MNACRKLINQKKVQTAFAIFTLSSLVFVVSLAETVGFLALQVL
jgi:hypothetical protein